MKKAQTDLVYDVIISGAGPVGLFLACELAMRNCSVLIIEKAESPFLPTKQRPFGIRGLSAPSIEALDRRGLLSELETPKRIQNPHQNAVQGARRQVGHFAGIPFHEGDIDVSKWAQRLPSSTPTSLIAEMEELESVLTKRAESYGVAIKRGATVTDIDQSLTSVIVHSETQIYQCKWLVGCDGARSVVRKLGGFEFAGTEPEFTGYSVRLDLTNPESLEPGRNFTTSGMYLQSQPGYLVLQDFDGGAFHDSRKAITQDHLQEVLSRISNTDARIDKLHYATTWTDRARQATSYREGRLLLAGDAAHIHSPLGGQGLNLGLGDAINLGWKLAAVINDSAPMQLLDTYQAERRPIGEKVLNWSRAQVAIMKTNESAEALNEIFRDLMNTRDGATYFAGRVWGLSNRYDLGVDDALVGQSVPNFEFTDGSKVNDQMRGGNGLLIEFGEKRALGDIAALHVRRFKYVSATANEQLGLQALLVRPDGIVAWVAVGELDTESLGQSIARWFPS